MPTLNKAPYLNLTLASFVRQSFAGFEIVVVDDGSEDDTAEVVRRYESKLNLTYVKQPNRGRSAARNAGIAACSGDQLIFNDDDRMVHGDFVAKHREAYERDENAVRIGGKGRALTIWRRGELILSGKDRNRLNEQLGDRWTAVRRSKYAELMSAEEAETNFEPAIARVFLGEEFESDHELGGDVDRASDFRLMWMRGTTANLSVSKQAVVDAGLFDTEFKGWGMEDAELCYRLYKNGLAIRECPEAYNYHQLHPIGRRMWLHRTLSRSRMADLRRNIDYFHRKSQSPDSYIFRQAFYKNIPPHAANEILIRFEEALAAKPRDIAEWDELYRNVTRSRKQAEG